MLDLSDLVKKRDYDAKTSKIVWKCFTTCDYDRFTSDVLNAKLVNKLDFRNLGKRSHLNTKLAALATKATLKVKQDKIVRRQ